MGLEFTYNLMLIGRQHQKQVLLIGRQHQKQVLFCDCENDAVTLMRLKLWPGSVTRPVLAFHLKLMELAEILLLECHVSLRKFCNAIGIFSKSLTLPLWVGTVLFNSTLLQYIHSRI